MSQENCRVTPSGRAEPGSDALAGVVIAGTPDKLIAPTGKVTELRVVIAGTPDKVVVLPCTFLVDDDSIMSHDACRVTSQRGMLDTAVVTPDEVLEPPVFKGAIMELKHGCEAILVTLAFSGLGLSCLPRESETRAPGLYLKGWEAIRITSCRADKRGLAAKREVLCLAGESGFTAPIYCFITDCWRSLASSLTAGEVVVVPDPIYLLYAGGAATAPLDGCETVLQLTPGLVPRRAVVVLTGSSGSAPFTLIAPSTGYEGLPVDTERVLGTAESI